MAEKYNLKWHAYTDHLQKMLKEMEDFTDVTLICDNKQKIRAHRNILAGCSPVFKSIFQSEDAQNPIIFLRGINHADMESILQFIYSGEASFYQDRMYDFLQAARSLEIEEIFNVASDSPESDSEDDEPSGEVAGADTQIEENLEKTLETDNDKGKVKSISEGSLFFCRTCEKTFTRNSTLKLHVETVHEGVKFKCQKCPKEFSQLVTLKKHVEVIHEGFKYKCQECPKEFSTDHSLRNHAKVIHRGIKHKCKQCPKEYSTMDFLTSHVKSFHEGKRIPCKNCSSSFGTRQDLYSHNKTHHSKSEI